MFPLRTTLPRIYAQTLRWGQSAKNCGALCRSMPNVDVWDCPGRSDCSIKPALNPIDDWALIFSMPANASQRRDLMEIVGKIRSRINFDPTLADAILDRLARNAHRVDLDGQSMRKTKAITGDKMDAN